MYIIIIMILHCLWIVGLIYLAIVLTYWVDMQAGILDSRYTVVQYDTAGS